MQRERKRRFGVNAIISLQTDGSEIVEIKVSVSDLLSSHMLIIVIDPVAAKNEKQMRSANFAAHRGVSKY